jgi:hypothetical protein
VKQRRINAEVRLAQAVYSWGKFDDPEFGRSIKNSNRAGYSQTNAAGYFYAFAVIHQHEVSFDKEREQDGLSLAWVQIMNIYESWLDRHGRYAQPIGRSADPAANLLRSRRLI